MEVSVPTAHCLPQFVQRIERLNVPFGREDSFKFTRGGVLRDRTLLGMRTRDITLPRFLQLCRELGMPAPYEAVIESSIGSANVVLFGLEPRSDRHATVKCYLEFWDEVRQRVRQTGSNEPLLLNLGVKWDSLDPQRHGLARYTCYPLLSLRDILRRLSVLLADGAPALSAAARHVLLESQRRVPGAAFVYLECEEEGNPRRSYDLNLYQSGLRVGEVRERIDQVCVHFGCAPADVWRGDPQLLMQRRLGHISGGIGRDGSEFMTFYYEIVPLP